MKKNLLITIVLLVTVSIGELSAQTEQGKFLIGASSSSLGFKSQTVRYEYKEYEGQEDYSGEYDSSLFAITLQGGYFISDHILIGAKFPYEQQKLEDSEYKSLIKEISIEPFVRIYSSPINNLSPYITASMGFGKIDNEYSSEYYYNEDYREDVFSYDFGIGLGLFITKSISLDFILLYSSTRVSDHEYEDFQDTTSGVSGNIGFSIFI